MLVVIPNNICCWEGLDDLLDFLLFIRVLGAREEKSDGPTTPNLALLQNGGRAHINRRLMRRKQTDK